MIKLLAQVVWFAVIAAGALLVVRLPFSRRVGSTLPGTVPRSVHVLNSAVPPVKASYHVWQEALDRMDEIFATTIELPLVRSYWAYWIQQRAGWAIGNQRDPETIDLFLSLGEDHLL